MGYFLFMATIVVIVLTFDYLCDRVVTKRRLALNQLEWNSFCKRNGLVTADDKSIHYHDFCAMQRFKHQWKYYYFPRM